MPKPNLPAGVYGLFVPATDGAWTYLPSAEWVEDPVPPPVTGFNPVGLYVKQQTAAANVVMVLNITKFLQQIAVSINAALGGQFGANLLAAFDLVYQVTGAGLGNFLASVQEATFVPGGSPIYKNQNNYPALIVTPSLFPSAPNNPGQFYVTRATLADYWLIGQNNPDTMTTLEVEFGNGGTSTFSFVGAQLYFGNV